MVDIIEADGSDELEKNKLLYKKLTHRGPTAFAKLLEILKENEYESSHRMLSASTVPFATFSNDDVVNEENKFLSIRATSNKPMRSNSYSPPSPIIIDNNNGESGTEDSVTSPDGCFNRSKKIKLELYTKKTTFHFDTDVEVKRAANFGTHPKLQVYSTKSKARGVFFFINIIQFKNEKTNRKGAEKDKENLITLFTEMNFKVFYYEDLTRGDFFELMDLLVKSEYIKNIDSFVFCIQTHGDMFNNQTIMEFSDGNSINVETVINIFSNTNCPNLLMKPKIFFFPFCRGKISDLEKKIGRIETDGVPGVPSFSDILICYGTVPGFVTHRDTGFGSWYVRELCKIFTEHACDCHLEDMLKMVSTRTMEIRDAGRMQVASTENRGFNKLLFFNPKIAE